MRTLTCSLALFVSLYTIVSQLFFMEDIGRAASLASLGISGSVVAAAFIAATVAGTRLGMQLHPLVPLVWTLRVYVFLLMICAASFAHASRTVHRTITPCP